MASNIKRKRNVLSIESKVEIINRLEKGESGASLSKIFNVGQATISEIKSRKDIILNYASKIDSGNNSRKRKTMKKAMDEKLDEAVYSWFVQTRSKGDRVSGPLLCKKALEFNKSLNGHDDFKASNGWLTNFKSRHKIRGLKIQGELLSNFDAEDNEEIRLEERKKGPTNDEAFYALETAMLWYEQQEECSPTQLILLKRMLDLAAKKRESSIAHQEA